MSPTTPQKEKVEKSSCDQLRQSSPKGAVWSHNNRATHSPPHPGSAPRENMLPTRPPLQSTGTWKPNALVSFSKHYKDRRARKI